MHAETAPKHNSNHAEPKKPYITLGDISFLVFVLLVSLTMTSISYTIWKDEMHSGEAKESGEHVVATFTEQGQKRGNAEANPPATCDVSTMTWATCRDAMFASSGPLAETKNTFSNENLLIAPACDRNDLHTLGSLIFEKGTPKPDGSGFSYSAIADDEKLDQAVPMRLTVCVRGFTSEHVSEFTF
jgi:hypothetical protein